MDALFFFLVVIWMILSAFLAHLWSWIWEYSFFIFIVILALTVYLCYGSIDKKTTYYVKESIYAIFSLILFSILALPILYIILLWVMSSLD